MTVSSANRKAGPYRSVDSTSGAGIEFPFTFKVFSTDDVQVVRTDPAGSDTTLTRSSHYSVLLNANQNDTPGGSVSLNVSLASGYKLTLTSNLAALQPIDITNSGGFYPDIIEIALDRQTMLTQQVVETLGRSITLPVSLDSAISTRLGAPVANGVLAWNATGDQLITATPESLSVAVSADDVRAALLAATIVDGDTLRAPSCDAVANALADEGSARALADDGFVDLLNMEISARGTAITTEVANRNSAIAAALPAGAIVDFDLDAAPAGYVYADGGTIGDGASGASTRANADTARLFAAQWARNATLRPLYDSAGSPVARGASAAADFDAHRRIRIGDLRDRVTRGYKPSGIGPGVGDTQEDAFQGHQHQVAGRPNTGGTGGKISTSWNGFDVNTNYGTTETIVDGANGTIRVADETRVKSFGTLKCYKL